MTQLTQMARAGVPQLRVGRVRRSGRRRVHPRVWSAGARTRSATSGSTSCARACASCCRSRSSSRWSSISQGAIQNFHGNQTVTTVTGQKQTIPGGPIASQEAIKEVGENGGGPFNANSIHPYENPNGITNVLEIWALLAIPFALTYTFGKMARDQKQGWVVFATMFILWSGDDA